MDADEAARPAPRRPRPSRALAVDAALAAGIAAVQVVGTILAGHGQSDREPLDAFGVALLVAGPLALLARRRHPVPTFAATFAATFVYLLLAYPWGPIWFAMIVAFATLVLQGHRVAALVGLGAGYVAFTWGPYLAGAEDAPTLASAVGLAAWLFVLLSGSELLRARRDRAEAAARSHEEESLRRVSEERLRIARELHDVVAHNISMINLQAGVALHLVDERPEQARTALAAIKDASKEALVELRSVLGVLRQVDGGAPRDPAPGLARVPDLVAQANAAGLEVRATVEGEARPVGRTVDLAAFRIVQEALTNVSRHAGPARADVRLSYGPRRLDVEVVDDGRGGTDPASPDPGPSPGSGSGLAGMRERAESVGGHLEAGPRVGFGWRVHARLPLPESREADSGEVAAGAEPVEAGGEEAGR